MIELIEWVDDRVTPDTIGEKIRNERCRRGMTQLALAIDANVSTAAVQQIEYRDVNPKLKTLIAVLDALGYELTIRERRDL